jgi:hypothetical protein
MDSVALKVDNESGQLDETKLQPLELMITKLSHQMLELLESWGLWRPI